jgi:hypothetical protein
MPSLPRTRIRSLFAICALSVPLAACSPPPQPVAPDPQAAQHTQVEAVRDTVTRVTHEVDAKRWVELRTLFADEVLTDYTSLFGGTPMKQTGDAVINGWKSALGKIQTHHQLGPVTVKLAGSSATATCQVRALHQADGAPGGTQWEVLGHYIFELSQGPDGSWKVQRMTILTRIQTGNRKLLQEANTAS